MKMSNNTAEPDCFLSYICFNLVDFLWGNQVKMMMVGFALQAACQTVFVACFMNLALLGKLNGFKSSMLKPVTV